MRTGDGGDGTVCRDLRLAPLHYFFIEGFGRQMDMDGSKPRQAKLR
jgi:hypothetical protein